MYAINNVLSSDYPLPFYSSESAEKKLTGFGPDLTQGINSTMNTLSSGRIIDRAVYTTPVSLNSVEHKPRGYDVHYSTPVSRDLATDSTASPSEHLYDLPLIRSSLDSPSPTEGLHLLPSMMGTGIKENGTCMTPKMNNVSPDTSVEKQQRCSSPLSFVSDANSGNCKDNL